MLTLEVMSGVIYQMLNYGVSTGVLFILVGVIYEWCHTCLISDYGGLAKVMLVYVAIFSIIVFLFIGLLGLNGFIGEFLILLGTFKSDRLLLAWLFVVLGAFGVILVVVYLLWMYKRVFFGEVMKKENKGFKDLLLREWLVLLSLVLMVVVMGVYL